MLRVRELLCSVSSMFMMNLLWKAGVQLNTFCFRMVSCGWDNIRLWRVRNGTLRSCPVDLGEYRSMDFSDVAFDLCGDDLTM